MPHSTLRLEYITCYIMLCNNNGYILCVQVSLTCWLYAILRTETFLPHVTAQQYILHAFRSVPPCEYKATSLNKQTDGKVTLTFTVL